MKAIHLTRRSRQTATGCHGRGFTLIELLVVIAIISLLVSILLPSLQKAKELAKLVTCLSQMKSTGSTMCVYSEENGGNFVPRACGHRFDAATCSLGDQIKGASSYMFSYKTVTNPGYMYLGRYWYLDYLEPQSMYCPSSPNTSYENNFLGSKEEYGYPYGSTSYYYRIGISDTPNPQFPDDEEESFHTAEEVMDSTKVLLFDNVKANNAMAWHGPRQNALFGDGSAETLEEDDLTSPMYYLFASFHGNLYFESEGHRIWEIESRR